MTLHLLSFSSATRLGTSARGLVVDYDVFLRGLALVLCVAMPARIFDDSDGHSFRPCVHGPARRRGTCSVYNMLGVRSVLGQLDRGCAACDSRVGVGTDPERYRAHPGSCNALPSDCDPWCKRLNADRAVLLGYQIQ